MLNCKISGALFGKRLFEYRRFSLGYEFNNLWCCKELQMTKQFKIVNFIKPCSTIQEANTVAGLDIFNVHGLKMITEQGSLRTHRVCICWVHLHFLLRSQILLNKLRSRRHLNFGGLILKIAKIALCPNHRFLFVQFSLFEVVLFLILTRLHIVGFINVKFTIVADLITSRALGQGSLVAVFVFQQQILAITRNSPGIM